MRRKKRVGVLAAVLLSASISQTAFGAWNANSAVQAQAESGYEFVRGETRIRLNQEAGSILDSLGKAEKIFEQDSCAYQGKDIIYSYDEFELATYPLNGKECVASIYFLNEKAETEEGLKIGSSYEEMVKTYGSNYKMENEVYSYTKNGVKLAFYMTGHKVDAIEYTLEAY